MWSPLVPQEVKNLVLPPLWHRFNPWPGEFLNSIVWPKKKKKSLQINRALTSIKPSKEIRAKTHLV